VILATSLSTVNNHDGFDTEYAPLETRLIDVSQTFCDGIELENPSQTMPAMAYVLYNGPSLTAEHRYTISDTVTVQHNSYQYWNYYLHHGSSMNASICIQAGNAVDFYIIQGSSNFEDWQDGYDNFVKFISVGAICPQTQSLSFDVVNTDDYFFAYAGYGVTTFETIMNFNRKEFEIVQENIDHSCSAGRGYSKKCTVSVPYSGKRHFLLATGNTSSGAGDEDGAAVSWSCESRVWVYLLAFFVPALFGIVVITIIFGICCIRQRKRNASYGRLGDDAATATAVTTTTFVTTTTATPPSAPPKDQPPPYSTATAPQAAGYSVQPTYPPYPATATYPLMPQSTLVPSMTQNYGATDNKP